MKDEIKEILDNTLEYLEGIDETRNTKILTTNETNILLDYITNLQEQLHQASLDIQELTEKDIGCPSWCDKLTNLQEENKRLKELCDKYEKEHSTEFKIWKDERHQLLDYKSRNENAQDLILNELSHLKANDEETWNKEFYDENNKLDYRKLCIELLNQVINLLDGGDKEC